MLPHPVVSPRLPLLLASILALAPGLAEAQLAAPSAEPQFGVRYGEPVTIRYRVGAEISANQGACQGILAMVAVPFPCPEQDVRIIAEDFSPHIQGVEYRVLQGGAHQMMISIPALPAGATARAAVTFEVSTRPILPPASTEALKIPQRPERPLRPFLGVSPEIEVRHRTIRDLAREVMEGVDPQISDWKKVEAIYDYMLSSIEYVDGPDKSALDTLRDKHADCQGRSMVFIALCRANDIPARMVWVDGHCYPEFYLEHAEGEGSWYPCESAGSRQFGEMSLTRTILQKGDNFSVPERPRERLRYASDFLIGQGGQPRVRYFRERVTQ